MRRSLLVITLIAFTLQATGCGTIIYPERRGQAAGKIDPQVAILDGLGLVLFIIPGVIAFAVDFATGAIYLPGGKRAQVPKAQGPGESVRVVLADPEQMGTEEIQRIVAAETGQAVSLEADTTQRESLTDRRELFAALQLPR